MARLLHHGAFHILPSVVENYSLNLHISLRPKCPQEMRVLRVIFILGQYMVCPMVQKVSSLSPTAVDICIYCQCLDMEAQLPPTAVDICIYCQCLDMEAPLSSTAVDICIYCHRV